MRWLVIILALIIPGITVSQRIDTDFSYMVHYPKIKSDKPPLVILLHGYGVNEKDLYGISTALNDHLLAFTLRAPYPVQDTSFCWFGMQFLPDKKFACNYPQAQLTRQKILSFISSACKTYGADSNQVFILGCSQGSMMAYDLGLSAQDKIKGVIIMTGLMLPETSRQIASKKSGSKPHFFIAHGVSDEVMDVNDGEEAALKLQNSGFDVVFKKYNMGHDILIEEMVDIQLWIRELLSHQNH